MKKEPVENFTVYLESRKKQLNEKLEILNETYNFFRKNIHNNFIVFDVAKHFNVSLKNARHMVKSWIKFEIVEVASSTKLPKTYRILKIPDDLQHQQEMK